MRVTCLRSCLYVHVISFSMQVYICRLHPTFPNTERDQNDALFYLASVLGYRAGHLDPEVIVRNERRNSLPSIRVDEDSIYISCCFY